MNLRLRSLVPPSMCSILSLTTDLFLHQLPLFLILKSIEIFSNGLQVVLTFSFDRVSWVTLKIKFEEILPKP